MYIACQGNQQQTWLNLAYQSLESNLTHPSRSPLPSICRTPPQHHHRLLADGLAREGGDHCHGNQPPGEHEEEVWALLAGYGLRAKRPLQNHDHRKSFTNYVVRELMLGTWFMGGGCVSPSHGGCGQLHVLAGILWVVWGCSAAWWMPLNCARLREWWMCSKCSRHSEYKNQAVCKQW